MNRRSMFVASVPLYEEDHQRTETGSRPISGLWQVGSRATWAGDTRANDLKLTTKKGAIDARVAIDRLTGDNRPSIDVSSVSGSLTIRLASPTRIETTRFDLRAESNSGNITVYLPANFHGVIMYRSRHLATFSRLASSLRGTIMTSAPVGCGGDVECDETMEVSYSDQPIFNDEIPDDCDGIIIATLRGRIRFLVTGEQPPALGSAWDHLKAAMGFGRALPLAIKCKD